VLVSPYVPTACRFYPSCSSYMIEAIEKKGIFRGVLYGLLRILKCNPFHPGGFDPVK
jgi:putative membrane protein insertion efficiency factor